MKKLILIVAVSLLGSAADAATLVLKGGRRLEVASLQRQGNLVILKYADGRVQSYPVSAVDLEATAAAAGAPAAVAPAAAPAGPHSPFFGAQAKEGKPVLVVTDDDVQHVKAPEEEGGERQVGVAKPASTEGQVVLVDYAKQKVDEATWEITATIRNTGGGSVAGVTADIRLLDASGASLGSGSATLDGELAPTQERAITARVSCPVEPIQIGFSFHWRAITPQTPPAEAGAGAGGGEQPAEPEKPTPAPASAAQSSRPPGFTVPPGSGPNTLPTNPMAVPGNLLDPPTSLQVARPQPPPEKPKA